MSDEKTGPATDADWKATSAYTSVYQDWRGWLEEGIVDQVMPMNYFRESAASQGAWFDRWVAWQRDHGPTASVRSTQPAAAKARRAISTQTPCISPRYSQLMGWAAGWAQARSTG